MYSMFVMHDNIRGKLYSRLNLTEYQLFFYLIENVDAELKIENLEIFSLENLLENMLKRSSWIDGDVTPFSIYKHVDNKLISITESDSESWDFIRKEFPNFLEYFKTKYKKDA